MKKLLITLYLIPYTLCLSAQSHFSISAGASNKYAVLASDYGWQSNHFTAEASLKIALDRIVTHPVFSGIRTGYIINPSGQVNYVLLTGAYYRMCSNDKRYLNGFNTGFAIKIIYKCFMAEPSLMGKTPIITAGLNTFF